MKTDKAALLFCALLAFGPPGGQAHAATPSSRQSCEGVIALDADGQMLLTEIKKGASAWCDAYIGNDPKSAIAEQVLAQCRMGSRCLIDGLYAGHGVFYWTKIISAKRR
ncbi:hypothetical protein JQ543_28015 [Bradyrhizobium diazoefficiens]|nr:hypothetical protein [Bradyrhizobium diazoefficiens]MBR0777223.1 hypothetical protein [Bradyrhizobium diazoefficiens]MBR0851619.1 hypothetical protein [Bradyrhizobium diazoefficiens]